MAQPRQEVDRAAAKRHRVEVAEAVERGVVVGRVLDPQADAPVLAAHAGGQVDAGVRLGPDHVLDLGVAPALVDHVGARRPARGADQWRVDGGRERRCVLGGARQREAGHALVAAEHGAVGDLGALQHLGVCEGVVGRQRQPVGSAPRQIEFHPLRARFADVVHDRDGAAAGGLGVGRKRVGDGDDVRQLQAFDVVAEQRGVEAQLAAGQHRLETQLGGVDGFTVEGEAVGGDAGRGVETAALAAARALHVDQRVGARLPVQRDSRREVGEGAFAADETRLPRHARTGADGGRAQVGADDFDRLAVVAAFGRHAQRRREGVLHPCKRRRVDDGAARLGAQRCGRYDRADALDDAAADPAAVLVVDERADQPGQRCLVWRGQPQLLRPVAREVAVVAEPRRAGDRELRAVVRLVGADVGAVAREARLRSQRVAAGELVVHRQAGAVDGAVQPGDVAVVDAGGRVGVVGELELVALDQRAGGVRGRAAGPAVCTRCREASA